MSERVIVEIVDGPQSGRRVVIDAPRLLLIGRSPEADIAFPDVGLFSPHHFLLEIAPPSCRLRDLDSAHGTFVNGKRVQQAELADGDLVVAGGVTFRVTLPTASMDMSSSFECLVCGESQPASRSVTDSRADFRTVSFICDECRHTLESSPQPIQGYRILKSLGRGGMGVVHLAERLPNGEPIALKVIVPESAASERAVQMFLREIAVMQQLVHPRIVRVVDFGMSHGQFYFAMEYVADCDIRALLRAASPRSRLQTACGVICQVLEALEYAHARSIVHRDIKPSNFLVSKEGQKLRTKVADFGLAKNFAQAGFSGITDDGDRRGTAVYVAPEQVIDSRRAQPPADLYSTAVALYNLASGKLPFPFEASRDPFGAILDTEPMPFSEALPKAPAALAALVDQNLRKDPCARSASALEFRKGLLPIAKGRF